MSQIASRSAAGWRRRPPPSATAVRRAARGDCRRALRRGAQAAPDDRIGRIARPFDRKHRLSDDVAQLAHVARPVVRRCSSSSAVGRDLLHRAPQLDARLLEEALRQVRDVLAPRLAAAGRRSCTAPGGSRDRRGSRRRERAPAGRRWWPRRSGRRQPSRGRRRPAWTSRDSSTRRSFACRLMGRLPISSRKQRAAVRQLEAPCLPAVCAGERALLVAEQLGLERAARESRRNRARRTACLRRSLCRWIACATSSLPRSGLAHNQDA